MHFRLSSRLKKIILGLVLAGGVAVFTHSALAQVSVDLPTSFAGFSSQDLKLTIANIVRIVLGFIGILFLLLVLYGGLVWMTSQGQPDKINRAKKIIASAVIGLLIVLSAYSIAGFIVGSLQGAVSPTPPGPPAVCGDGAVTGGEQCDDGNTLNGDGCSAFCAIEGVIPGCTLPTVPGSVKVCNVTNPAYRSQVAVINGYNFGASVGTVTINGVAVTPVACGPSSGWSGGSIVVDIPATIPLGTIGAQNVVVTRSDSATCAAGNCGVTNVSIGSSPFIRCMTPNFGPSNGTGDIKVEGGNFGTVQGNIEMEGAAPAPANRFLVGAANLIGPWTNEEVHFRAPAAGAPQQAVSGDVVLVTSTAARSNGMPFTVTCSVASSASSECATNCCTPSLQCRPMLECVAAAAGGPFISSINPNNGEEGNYVTINGSGFGAARGTSVLHFLWPDATNTDYPNSFPSNPACTANWSDTQIIMEVPPVGGVGDGPDSPPNGIVWVTTGVGDSNQVPFTINDIVRPGLCKVSPTSGFPNLPPPFHLNGNNMSGAAQKIFFGVPPGIDATSPNFIDAQNADGMIPNLIAGTTTVAFSVGVGAATQYSNPLDFAVLGVAAGDPIINSVTPLSGPSGTYVTIQGANFGTTIGKVFLSPIGHPGCGPGSPSPTGNDCLADIAFPAMCSTDFWRDDQIIVKVPKTGPPGNTPAGNYFFIVQRASTPVKTSQMVSIPNTNGIFVKNDALPVTPGLCRINPVGGPAGTPVDYFGENFGVTPGPQSSIWFDKDAGVTTGFTWTDTQVLGAVVPGSAITGTTTVQHNDRNRSNPIPFFVGSCTSNLQCGSATCCSGVCRVGACNATTHDENNWQFTSGQYDFDLERRQQCTEGMQTPTPFPYDHVNMNWDGFFDPVILPVYDENDPITNAPLDVAIAAEFNRPLNYATIEGPLPAFTDNGVRIFRCNAASPTFNGTGCTEVTGDGDFAPLGSVGFKWTLHSGLKLNPETWYEVRLDDGSGTPTSRIQAVDGSFYKGSQFLGDDTSLQEPDDFKWHFRTRTVVQGSCEINAVSLNPATLTVPVGGIGGPMVAVPTSAQCYVCGGDYLYDWDPNPIGAAPYATYNPVNPPFSYQTNFSGLNITPAPVDITATLRGSSNPSGIPITSNTAALSVAFIPPYVTSHSPDSSCEAVCRNVAPFATFNMNVRSSTITTANIQIRQCNAADPLCTTYTGGPVPITLVPLPAAPDTNRVDITPTGGLLPATKYRVILTNGIQNSQGQGLTLLNYPSGAPTSYSWTFQTSLAICEADGLNVTPVTATIPSLGGTQDYIAHPTATLNCGSGPVPVGIDANRYNYGWYSNNFTVATMMSSTLNQGTMQGVSAVLGIPPGITQAHVDMTNKAGNPAVNLSAEGEVVVKDSRKPINFIGHRPDDAPHSPPENASAACAVQPPGTADPLQCANQCRNVQVSAFFSTPIDPNSFASGPPSGLVARYTFDDGTGKDVVGGNTAVLAAAPSDPAAVSGAQCVLNRCMDLDLGAPPFSASSDNMTVTNFSGLPTNEISISAWVSARTFTGVGQRILGHDWATTNTPGCTAGQANVGGNPANPPCVYNHGWLLYAYAPGDFYFGVYGSPWNDQHVARFTAPTASPNTLYHLVGTYDGSIVKLYVNGVAAPDANGWSPSTPSPIVLDTTGDVVFGSSFDGALDDVQIYNRALSPVEVSQVRLMATGAAGASANFNVTDMATGAVVPGTISVHNYQDPASGVCTINTAVVCNPSLACPAGAGECNYTRGRVDFTPALASTAASTAGLVSKYSFDAGTAQDEVGANNGTLNGGVIATAPNASIPYLQGGMSLDGVDDNISFPAGTNYDYPNFTVSFWAKANTVALKHVTTMIGKGDWNDPANHNWYLGFKGQDIAPRDATSVSFVYGVPWDSGASLAMSSFDATQWHHYAGVATPTNEYLYIDGTLRASIAAGHASVSNGQPGTIGHTSYIPNLPFFKGEVDDVRIFNRALSAGEVNQIRQEALGTAASPGVFAPSTSYKVNICNAGSCSLQPILSDEGMPFVTPLNFAFKTKDDVCQISYVEVSPNPAEFTDRRLECLASDAPLCTNATPKAIIAQAKDQTGSDLTAAYTWRKTIEKGGSYSSQMYVLDQSGTQAQVQHKGVLGIDYNEVTADGGVAGTAKAQGRMDFSFCEKPWIGDTGPNTAYYLDPTYDLKLSYCRDAAGLSEPTATSTLPNLPAPHIIRSGTDFTFGGDLIKEHVFIVGTNVNSTGTLTSGNPVLTPVTGISTTNYHLGDFVYIKLDARDPEGDSFLYTMTGEGGADALPASASFNPRTGVFMWVIDKIPTTNGDANANNDFAITFNTTPASTGASTVYINVVPTTTTTPVNPPVVSFTSATVPAPPPPAIIEGGTMNIDYGKEVIFNTNVTGYGGGAAGVVKSFVWDFQDSGLTSYTDIGAPTYSARHTFLQSGLHQVTFRVQNSANAWSLPAVVNIIVRPKTSMLDPSLSSRSVAIAGSPFKALIDGLRSLFARTAFGQSQGAAPSEVAAVSVDDASTTNNLVNVQLSWRNNGTYNGIKIYRDNAAVPIYTSPAGPIPTTYTDPGRTIGTDYVYKVCGIIGTAEKCTEVTTTARRVDYDIIVARVYRNIGMLSVREWYEAYAPNPTGSPASITVDGYDAIKDGSSVYVGMANCVDPVACTGNPGIYTNILLLSYNENAQQSTKDIFDQLVSTIRINERLVTRDNGRGASDTCSGDATISCDTGHDAVCQAKNAGLCTSAKAELRRDHKRVVDLHSIKASLDGYALQHHFCDDGTNSRACNVDSDCGAGRRCIAAYPSLSSGSYLGGISTSQWPSWNATLAQDLNSSSLPKDPINKFGANFYSATPASCLTLVDGAGNPVTGHDKDTCWNQRTLKMQCQRYSEVYVYKNSLGSNYNLYANAEARTWRWANLDTHVILTDPTLGNLCLDNARVNAVCGNGVVERYCSNNSSQSCAADADCGAGNTCVGERCDGGFTNYCDYHFGEARWNTDFTVGCNATCSDWGDPYAPNTATAGRAACGGACGDGIAQTPASSPPGPEQCDGAAPATTHCTSGGAAYCTTSCQVACTQGRPYSGTCNDGIVQAGEVCDEGNILNGTPGHCNRACSGYGSFCGDGTLTPTTQTDLGCTCDSAVSCTAGRAVMGAVCARSCAAAGPAHLYSCVSNTEECDTVAGLTNYSCPANSTLYCDTQCNRACTADLRNDTAGNRQSIPVYEHYYNVANDEDFDYTTLKVADAPYTTKGIAFYANPLGACPGPSGVTVNRYASTTNKDIILRTSLPAGSWTLLGPEFCAYTGAVAADSNIVPVYDWAYSPSSNPKTSLPSDSDHKFSRSSSTAPINGEGTSYVIQNSGSPIFWARLGPLQETCGNDVLEGLEECEPGTYQVPTAEQATSDNRQYQCGAVFTPNACRLYGGWCGDGAKNDPFEQCDEGLRFVCSGNAATTCKNDDDCSKLGYGTCLGNGAPCNNAAGNCTYCTKSCGNGLIPRNYCGDGIVNCGVDAICGNADDVEICDDGADNGKSLKCNETCSGLTGTVCGKNGVERFCSNNSANKCDTPGNQTLCTTGGGVCTGEVCDDGVNNGRWTNTCSNNADCRTDADCGAFGPCGSGTPHAFCNFSCLGPTVPYCGDGVVEARNAGPDGKIVCSNDATKTCTQDAAGDAYCRSLPGGTPADACNKDYVTEVCDLGAAVNGQPGQCNASCTGLAPSQCGNGTIDNGRCTINVSKPCTSPSDCTSAEGQCRGTGTCTLNANKTCQDDSGCLAGEGTCAGVETCDQPSSAPVLQACNDDTWGAPGKPGLQTVGCNLCVSQSTQCHAFGLKIWSDGADVAYLNGHMMLLDLAPPGAQCVADPSPNGADYSDAIAESPAQPNSNKCVP